MKHTTTLTYPEAAKIIASEEPFDNYSTDDLDYMYYVATNQWAFHKTREAYILNLEKKRKEIKFVSKHINKP
jgi:hypothetical protein